MLNVLNKNLIWAWLVKLIIILPILGGLIFAQDLKPELNLVVQNGHAFDVNSVSISSDGKLLATCGTNEGVVKLWDFTISKELKNFRISNPTSVKFSPNGKILAVSAYEFIKLFDVESGKEIKSFETKEKTNYSVTFSPNGQILAVGRSDNVVKLFDVASGGEIKSLAGHSDRVSSVAFSPNGQILASGSHDGTIKFWDYLNGKELKSIQASNSYNRVSSIAFSPDGKMLVSGIGIDIEVYAGGKNSEYFVKENTVKLWDVETGLELNKLEGHHYVISTVAFSPDGKTIVGGGWGGNLTEIEIKDKIVFWDAATGRKQKGFEGDDDEIESLIFTPDGKTLITGSNLLKTWNVESKTLVNSIKPNRDYISNPTFSNTGKFFAYHSLGQESSLIFNIENQKETKSFPKSKGGSNDYFDFSPDDNILIRFNKYEDIIFWDTKTGKIVKSISFHLKAPQIQTGNVSVSTIQVMKFSPDKKLLVTSNNDNIIRIWDVETGKELKTLSGHTDWVQSLAFSPDGKTLASGGHDKTIKLWDLASGREIKSWQASADLSIRYVGFKNDKTLRSDDRSSLKEWDIESGKELKSVSAGSFILSFANTPNGPVRVVENQYGVIEFWNENTEKEIGRLFSVGENEWIVVTPDGRFDATDRTFKLLHYSYGLEVIELNQLKEMYYEPNLLAKIMGYSKEPLRPIIPLKNVRLYPEVVEQKVDPKTKKLTVKLKNRGGGFGAVKVFVNDKLVIEDARDAKLRQNPTTAEQFVTITADLKDGAFFNGKLCEQIDGKEVCRENKVTVVTSNYLPEIGKGNISSRGSEVIYLDNENSNNNFKLPNLYAIIGGVSDYTGIELDLSFASKDAEDFANALNLGAKRLFCPQENPNCLNKIQIKTFSTSGKAGTTLPTKENLRNAFAEIAQKAQPEDIVLIYLAGHGVSLSGTDTYFYLTQEARTANKEELAKVFQTTTISSDELLCWLSPVQCDGQKQLQIGSKPQLGIKSLRQVIILDTCASGKAGEKLALTASRDLTTDQRRAIEFLKDKSGTHILMGSTADKPSYEASQFGQGLLTRALLEGMSGAALQKPNGFVDVQTLFRYAETRVPQLAQNIGGVQMPTNSSPLGKTFVIGQIGDTESKEISRKLPVPKPFVLRPAFGNSEEDNFDSLGINSNLAKLLNDENNYLQTRGQSALVFLNEDSFPGAIKPTGLYTIVGENVRVKGSLRCEGQRFPFEVEDTKQKIVEKLLATIRQELGKIKPESCQVK